MNYILWFEDTDDLLSIIKELDSLGFRPSEDFNSGTTNRFLMIIPERQVAATIDYRTAVEFRELFDGYKFTTLGELRSVLEP